ncbi:uncharacterized protein LOC103715352 [Phoenix dactylifera]|uniref:Uncharacterized protein LOC103715352 n=1 Tax=Phoenix dactylifera TaxID=42345 RepID=A0A8B7CKP6_PHODC|nr:uncharacterized protein LOC103715352 [Phoenix dactylifera]
MAEIPKPGFGEAKPSASAMSLDHEEVERSKTEESDGFVAIDIGALSILSVNNDKDSTCSPRVSRVKNLSRKGSQRSGGGEERTAAEGETADSSTGGPDSDVKSALLVHVAGEGEPSGLSHATTPTAAGGRCRRLGRRQTPWLDPRRVLFFFATLSSMGTMILLYFTLSMGKMAGNDSNAR